MQFIFGDHNKKEPDFMINGCGIELTSIRFPNVSDKMNIESKLINKLRKKNKMEYANSNSILLIEATQPIHYANQSYQKPTSEFNLVLKSIGSESNFGIVLCYVEYTVIKNHDIEFKDAVYPAFGKSCTDNVKELFQKITNGTFNTFDGTQSISKY